MAELSSSLDNKSATLLAARLELHSLLERLGSPLGLRRMALAAEWAGRRSADLAERRSRLRDAEAELLWRLQARPRAETTLPRLRSRSPDDIEADLDAALEALAWLDEGTNSPYTERAELRVAELTYELAVAEHNRHLLAVELPQPEVIAALNELIDLLGFELARRRSSRPVEWAGVADAAAAIRGLLDESWFGDVGRADLIAIQEVLAALAGPELDAVVARLSDDELYRWFHELDGVRGGNLDAAEEAGLFAVVARKGSAVTLFRLANAERGSRFLEVARAVQDHAPDIVALEFIEMCASAAGHSEAALMAALAGIARLDGARRSMIVTSLQHRGLLEPLAAAIETLLSAYSIERDSPLIVEFFAGLLGALSGAATTLAGLSVAGLVDRHRFREAWSNLGGIISLAFHDPMEFARVVLDIETLRRNPARWTGAAIADLASAGLGRLAKLGRLGKLAAAIARWIDRVGAIVLLDVRRLQLRARHVDEALRRIDAATDGAAVRDALAAVAQVELYVADLDELINDLPHADRETVLQQLEAMALGGAALVDHLIAAVRAAAAEPASTG